jgi:hypothetical protein
MSRRNSVEWSAVYAAAWMQRKHLVHFVDKTTAVALAPADVARSCAAEADAAVAALDEFLAKVIDE